MSYLLRHHPEDGPIMLDHHGWADVHQLIQVIQKKKEPHFTEADLSLIVQNDAKQRYAFNEDHTKIRASQGHSIPVDVELTEAEPPAVLYHGTGEKSVPAILKQGLKPMSRLYVHLSLTSSAARDVGSRHGHPIVFQIDAGQMYMDGYKFYLSANHVWLTDSVPVKYLHQITY